MDEAHAPGFSLGLSIVKRLRRYDFSTYEAFAIS